MDDRSKISEGLPFLKEQINSDSDNDPMHVCNALHWALVTYWPTEDEGQLPVRIPLEYYEYYTQEFSNFVRLSNYAFYRGMNMIEVEVDESSEYHDSNLQDNEFFILGREALETKDEFYSATYNGIISARADMRMVD